MNAKKILPLTGILFVILATVGFLVGGEPPDAEKLREVVDFYDDNKDTQRVSALLVSLAATSLVFFGGCLRGVLRSAEGEGGVLSAVAFAGAVVLATGIAIDATISFALAETAGKIDDTSLQALAALWENDFFPLAVGTQLLLLAAGISIAKHGALPRWLGWVAIVLALIAVSPIGFVSFLALGVWIIIVSVLLFMAADSEAAVAPPPSAPQPPPPPA